MNDPAPDESNTPTASERTFAVVFDREDRRPYCVLLQAAFGGDHGAVSRFFDARHWHVSPTDNPVRVQATASQLEAHNARLNEIGAPA